MYDLRQTPQRSYYKRKFESDDKSISSKRQKVSGIDWSKWASATSTRAYMLKDPLLDWLKNHTSKFISTYPSYTERVTTALRDDKESSTFTSFIMDKGVSFETNIDDIIKTKFPEDFIDIGGAYLNARSDEKYEQTVNAIHKGIPIIFSGVLRDYDNCTYGIPDLIVRSDWIDKFITISPLTEIEKTMYAPDLESYYHYLIIDIKFTTLKLRCNGIHLLNDGMIPCYKSQLYIYNRALAKIQGYDPQKAFILGRRWTFTQKGETYKGDCCFDRLGTIDYESIDKEILTDTDDAVHWILDVRKNGHNWNPMAMNHPNLFPNMSNTYDFPWHEVKEKIAKETHEITTLWMCNTKHRKNAHGKGVFKWSDPLCTTDALGINGPVTKKILGEMLKINQQKSRNISPNIIKNVEDWSNEYVLEFYVDFETINDVVLTDFKNLPYSKPTTILFMIGLGYIDPVFNIWIYNSFIVEEFSQQEEKRICKLFIEYINRRKHQYKFEGSPPMFHWSPAEPGLWQSIIEKYDQCESWDLSDSWIDMLKIFKSEPIVMRGVFDFSLKSIAKAMHQYGMIDCTWGSMCVDGASAMIAAHKAQVNAKQNRISMTNTILMKDIEKYNEVDCKTVYEIVKYLRNNMVIHD